MPGGVTTGKTRQEIVDNMCEAIRGHLEIMAEYGKEILDEDLEAVTLSLPKKHIKGYADEQHPTANSISGQ